MLLDALAHRPLPKPVAAGDIKSGHQCFTVDKQSKTGHRKSARTKQAQGVKFSRMCKHDHQHTYSLEQVEHTDGAGSTGFGSFHIKQGPPLEAPLRLPLRHIFPRMAAESNKFSGANARFLFKVAILKLV